MGKRSMFKARFKRQLLPAFLCVIVAVVFDSQRFQPLGRGIARVVIYTVIGALCFVFVGVVVDFIFQGVSKIFKRIGDRLLGRDIR